MAIIKDLTNQRFGRLTVMWPAGYQSKGKILWMCACECGAYSLTRRDSLLEGRVVSCGCKVRDRALAGVPHRSHGLAHTSEYNSFCSAYQRCNNPNDRGYKNYGGRGIKFLFTSFAQFYAEMGNRPSPAHSVDRINNDGNYEPGNLRWATRKEQNNNKRKI